MKNFNREDTRGFLPGGRNGERNGGGRQDNLQKKDWRGSDHGSKEHMMHKAVCSECGKRCEVPFRPMNGKPVYCNDCFAAKRSGSDRNDRIPAKFHYENRNNGEGGSGAERQLAEISRKLDRLINTIETFMGTGAKSVLAEVPKKEEKKNVDVVELKKALDQAVEKEPIKTKVVSKKAMAAKKKK